MRWFIELLPIQNASHTRNIWKKSTKKRGEIWWARRMCVCVCICFDGSEYANVSYSKNQCYYLSASFRWKPLQITFWSFFFAKKQRVLFEQIHTREKKLFTQCKWAWNWGEKAKQFLWVNDKWMLTAGLFPNPYSSVIPNMTSISHLRTKRNMHSPLEKRALFNERDTFLFSNFIQKYESYTDWSPHYYRWRSFQYCMTECVPDIIIWCGDDIIPEGSRIAITIFFAVGVRCFRGKKKSKLSQNGQKERKSQTDPITARMYVNQYV